MAGRTSAGRLPRTWKISTLALSIALIGTVGASTANAAVTVSDDPNAIATSIVVDPGTVGGTTFSTPLTGSNLAVDYPCVFDDPATTDVEDDCPTGIGDAPAAGFPTNSGSYGILTTGNAALADDANTEGGSGVDWGVSGDPPIGPSAYDYQITRIDLGAATTSCLAFDFRFLSEEFPEYVGSGFNDAFIAQLNTFAVTADPSTQSINAPGDFAAGPGDIISVDASGPSAMNEAEAAGTTYDGATLRLIARTPVSPGSTNSLFLTTFDQGDGILDTAVFVDNLRYEEIDPAKCKSLALDPFEGTSGVILVADPPPTFSPDLSTLSLPVNCNLPPGPVPCNIDISASFSTIGDAGTVGTAKRAAATTTLLATGSASVPAGETQTVTLTNTPEGTAAVAKAAGEVDKLIKKAKKTSKKAKKTAKAADQADGQEAQQLEKKAAKLKKKAKKLRKKAKALAAQPLGNLGVTFTNQSNGASSTETVSIPR